MEADVYPYFRAIEGKQGTEVEMGGHKVLMFGSNAYTGLTGDQRIIDAAKRALDKYGSGCAGSRFLNGTLDLHVQLEKEISEFIGKDDCLCFSTGFSVNQGVLAMVVGKDDYIICDDRDHASIVDGRRLSFAKQLHYKHNDMDDLERVLKNLPYEAISAQESALRGHQAHRCRWCLLYGRRLGKAARDCRAEAQVQLLHHGRRGPRPWRFRPSG